MFLDVTFQALLRLVIAFSDCRCLGKID